MIRTKVILVFTTSLIMISCLLGIHLYETSKEIYLHKRLDSMHHEYLAVLSIKQAVNNQIKETFSGVVFGYSKQQLHRYQDSKASASTSIEDLVKTISNEFDYIDDPEKEHEEGEEKNAHSLQEMYFEIDTKLDVINKLISQKAHADQVNSLLAEVETLFDSFALFIEEWVEHEGEELLSVESTFSKMTSQNTMLLIVGSVISLLFAMTMTLSIILLIIDPRMNEIISGIKRVSKGDLDTPILLKGSDEFTVISKAFNQMMEQLQSSQKKLLEQSYYSGMAEMVSGILHNIKNSFSPFIVDAEITSHHLKKIKLAQLQNTLSELNDDNLTLERRKDLLDLSGLLVENYQEILTKVDVKLSAIQNRASLIEKIIEEQSSLASSKRLKEEVSIYELLYDSLSLIKRSYLEKVPVMIFNDVEKVGSVKTHRIVLLQVFSNIILNAIESVLRAKNTSGKILIHGEITEKYEQEVIHITITDDGEGIEPDRLKEIFKRGTSAKSKQSGLGLHWCANSISALQGRIYAESDGLGKGAEFHLYLKKNM